MKEGSKGSNTVKELQCIGLCWDGRLCMWERVQGCVGVCLHAYVLCVCVCMCAYVRLCVSEGFFDYGKRILGRGLGLTVY